MEMLSIFKKILLHLIAIPIVQYIHILCGYIFVETFQKLLDLEFVHLINCFSVSCSNTSI